MLGCLDRNDSFHQECGTMGVCIDVVKEREWKRMRAEFLTSGGDEINVNDRNLFDNSSLCFSERDQAWMLVYQETLFLEFACLE